MSRSCISPSGNDPTSSRPSSRRSAYLRAALMAFVVMPVLPAAAQNAALQPGEAFLTRFSGSMPAAGTSVIDPNGTVGSIIDLRGPGQPPQGQHWVDEPQRQPITAAQVGQVFGVALDDAPSPSIFIASTAAFGLHRTADNSAWMPGMFGPLGPAAIYRLDAANGYQPQPFAQVTLGGRQNTGPGLGNIAYDRFNKQVFVSDLETGMIHRLRASDGTDLGTWDHGTQGRANFLDVESKAPKSLSPIAFDPASRARVDDCPSGNFSASPECWNFAQSGRRVFGLGVMRNAQSGETRLYYAVNASPAFGNGAWSQASEDEKRNSVWSVRLAPDGSFDGGDVRREFLLPDFFTSPQDVERAGYSSPVSDISFQACGSRPVMLVAERGTQRNLGLDADDAFATPHEARSLRYEYDGQNGWRPIGRYDVGNYVRGPEGMPYMRANCAGGATFAYGYDANFNSIDRGKTDQFVWNSGDALCSPEGPCMIPGAQAQADAPPQGAAAQPAALQNADPQADDSQVHGIQGTPENAYDELVPNGALAQTPGEASPSTAIPQSYMIDADVNLDPQGNPVGLERNDATRIGDVAVFQVCPQPAMGFMPLPPPVMVAGHAPTVSHAMYASHGRQMSHYRFGSHAPEFSHYRFASHYRFWSHNRSGSHERRWSHHRYASHERRESHNRTHSHVRSFSHYRWGSHDLRRSHSRFGSHDKSRSHWRTGSHNARASHSQLVSHARSLSHLRTGSHDPRRSHTLAVSHSRTLSHLRSGSHSPTASHSKLGSHSQTASHNRAGSIQKPGAGQKPVHSRAMSLSTSQPVHTRAISQATTKPVHSRAASLAASKPVHSRAASQPAVRPVHSRAASQPKVSPKVQQRPNVQPRPMIQQRPAHSRQQSVGPGRGNPSGGNRF
jgi:hypothetical protein